MVGRHQDGKNYYSDACRREVMSLCRRGVGSVAAIALANGLNPNGLRRSLSVDGKRPGFYGKVEETAALLPVIIEHHCKPAEDTEAAADTAEEDDATILTGSTI